MSRRTPFLRTDPDKSLIVMYCDRCRKIRFYEPEPLDCGKWKLTCKGCGDVLYSYQKKG